MTNYLDCLKILAALYTFTDGGWLLLALPPARRPCLATAGRRARHVHRGARLWLGVIIGTPLLNAWNSGVFADASRQSPKLLAAFAFAIAPIPQALAGRAMIARCFGLPLPLNAARGLFKLPESGDARAVRRTLRLTRAVQ